MMKNKIIPLIVAIIIFLSIVLWPVYFFTSSLYKIIPLAIGELVFFVVVEIILVIILIAFWEFYKRCSKN